MIDFRKILARAKVFFFKGWVYCQMPAIGITAAYAIEQKYGIPFLTTILAGLVVCIVIGWTDYHHGIAKNENDLGWEMTPIAVELCKNVKETRTMVGEMSRRDKIHERAGTRFREHLLQRRPGGK